MVFQDYDGISLALEPVFAARKPLRAVRDAQPGGRWGGPGLVGCFVSFFFFFFWGGGGCLINCFGFWGSGFFSVFG